MWNIWMPDAQWYGDDATPAALEWLVKQIEDTSLVALDTETTGLNIVKDIPLYWSISWRDRQGTPYRVCLKASYLNLLRGCFQDPNKSWIFCNAKYDAHILANVGIHIRGKWYDTAVMHALLYEEMPHGLKETCAQILGWKWRDFKDTFGAVRKGGKTLQEKLGEAEKNDLTTLVEYASNDAYGTYELFMALRKELEAANTYSLYPDRYATLWDIYYKTEVPFTKVLWKCERAGIKVDMDFLKSKEAPMVQDMRDIEKEIARVAGRILNPNSPADLRNFFFTTKGYKPKRLTKGGKTGLKQPSADAEFLEELDDPVAKLILQYRDISKTLGTYVHGLIESADANGRVHTRYNQDVARTGRLSSSNPNLQNIKRPDDDAYKIRQAFIAPQGTSLIVRDYEQLEMRLLACAAMEADMIDIFRKNWDIHMGNASLVFQTPYDDIAAAKKIDKLVKEGKLPESAITDYVRQCLHYRQVAKSVGFGLNYGMKENKLARQIGVSVNEAKSIIEQYMARYPAVANFYKEAIEEARITGYAFTLLGRRRSLPDILSENAMDRWTAERQASNQPIQGTAADVVRLAMIQIDDAGILESRGARMLLQVHDEICVECPTEYAQEVNADLKEIMEHPLPNDLAVLLATSGGIGPNWCDAKLAPRITWILELRPG